VVSEDVEQAFLGHVRGRPHRQVGRRCDPPPLVPAAYDSHSSELSRVK
jgi:hypothetical protein